MESLQVDHLINVLWLTLSDLDDLTSSTSSVLSLISALVTSQEVESKWSVTVA